MVFLSHLSINVMILPRQARDKHRESSTQKRELRFVLLQGWLYAPVNGNLIYANQGVQWAGQQMAAEGDLVGMLLVGKPSFFSPFSFIKICIRIHFAKTGSGQPAGKLENQRLCPQDRDVGTLSVFLNGQKLGVMARGRGLQAFIH
jgi:hypothetical protein